MSRSSFKRLSTRRHHDCAAAEKNVEHNEESSDARSCEEADRLLILTGDYDVSEIVLCTDFGHSRHACCFHMLKV